MPEYCFLSPDNAKQNTPPTAHDAAAAIPAKIVAGIALTGYPARFMLRYFPISSPEFAIATIFIWCSGEKTLVDGIRKYNATSIAVNPPTAAKPTALPNGRESNKNTTADKTAQNSSLTSR